jgi:hypothetical protein
VLTPVRRHTIGTNGGEGELLLNMAVLRDTAPCSVVEVDRRIRGACCFCHQVTLANLASIISLTSFNDKVIFWRLSQIMGCFSTGEKGAEGSGRTVLMFLVCDVNTASQTGRIT